MPSRPTNDEEAQEAEQSKATKQKKKRKKQSSEPTEEVTTPNPVELNETEIPKVKKPRKKNPEPEPEPEEDEPAEEEGEEDEGKEEIDEEKVKHKMRMLREHKRTSGFRGKANEAGYVKDAGFVMAQGLDSFASLLSAADAKRLLRFFPEVLEKSSYDVVETKERMTLGCEPLPISAAREAQAHLESVFRFIMTEALNNSVEGGKVRVNAQHMYAAIRRYSPSMKYTAVLPPKGLIKHALDQGVKDMISVPEDLSKEKKMSDKKENDALVKELKKMEEMEKARKEAYRARQAALASGKEASINA